VKTFLSGLLLSVTIVPAALAAPPSKAAASIAQALDKLTEVDLQAVPLDRALEELGKQHQLPIRVDAKALASVGVRVDPPITLHVGKITLRSALNLISRSVGLDWTRRNDVLLMTTPEQAEATQETRRHEVLDLVAIGKNVTRDMESQLDYDPLADLAMSVIEPTTWEPGTGPPTNWITPDRGALVFRQVPRVHDECEDLFVALRRAIRDRVDVVRLGSPAKLRNEERLRKVMEEKTDLNVARAPLVNVLAMLGKRHGIPIVVSQWTLEDEGIRTTGAVSLRVTGKSLKSVLRSLLEPWNLVAAVHDEVVLVTHRENVLETEEVVVYRTADLMSRGKDEDREAVRVRVQEVLKKIQGNSGSCEWFRNDGLLVCLGTSEAQEAVLALLTSMPKDPNLRPRASKERGSGGPPTTGHGMF
jgi:hypothetical protein